MAVISLLFDPLHPGQKGGPESLWIQQPEHPVEGVMRRDPVGQFQKRAQPGFLILGKLLDAFPVVHAAEGAQDGDENDVEQHVPLAADLARIWNPGKVLRKSLGFGTHGMQPPQKVLP